VCANCHGTPGANDGNAPDLQGTSSARINQMLHSDDHPGGQANENWTQADYDNLAAYLAGDQQDGNGGQDDGDDGQEDDGDWDDGDGDDGQDDGDWDDGDWDDGDWDDGDWDDGGWDEGGWDDGGDDGDWW